MDVKEKVREQLSAGKPFVRLTSHEFCDLARPLSPSEDSTDGVERSMAMSLRRMDGKHNEKKVNVDRKVAAKLIGRVSALSAPTGGSGGKDDDKGKK